MPVKKSTKERKDQGAKNKSARVAAQNKLNSMTGKDISKMSAKEKEDLLIVLFQIFGLADDKGIIK